MNANASIDCPSCKHANPGWRRTCERCSASLAPAQRAVTKSSGRPGCIAAYALLVGLSGLIFTLGLVLTVADLASDRASLVAQLPMIGLLALFPIFLLTLATGLWRMKRWARLIAMGIHGLAFAAGVSAIAAALILERAALGPLDVIGLVAEMAPTLLISGSVWTWLARNGGRFGASPALSGRPR